MSVEQPQTSTEGVQSLHSGVNHNASWERSYNADGQVYSNLNKIRQDWQDFLSVSQQQNRRRAVMRCYATGQLLRTMQNNSELPIEAAIPFGNEYLIWIGQNQHAPVSISRDVSNLPSMEPIQLAPDYKIDTVVREADVANLINLWGQFGWSPTAVRSFVRDNANGNPITLIRNMEQEAIGVMIAESVEFGAHRLVEITELAVNPEYRGQNLATILIQQLTKLSLEYWNHSLVFGEYNQTTKSYSSAARAGQLPGQSVGISGVLHDHVGIETGEGNEIKEPWNTRWLHNFLVMYQPNRRIQG